MVDPIYLQSSNRVSMPRKMVSVELYTDDIDYCRIRKFNRSALIRELLHEWITNEKEIFSEKSDDNVDRQ